MRIAHSTYAARACASNAARRMAKSIIKRLTAKKLAYKRATAAATYQA